MARGTWLLAATTAAGLASTIWLYLDNRALRGELGEREAPPAVDKAAAADAPADRPAGDVWDDAVRANAERRPSFTQTPMPSLPSDKKETRMDRRARRTEEIGAMLGRGEGETEADYRARMVPLIQMGLAQPRERVAEMRKLAEEKARVTPEQSARLDQAFEKVYDDVLSYTNKAISDGQLSPYERNVAGWLDFAGGLGGILTEAQGQVGKILDAGQVKAMYDSGFEWGEYLGLSAPWEKLTPPPQRR